MRKRKLGRYVGVIVLLAAFGVSPVLARDAAKPMQFSSPLGFRDGQTYGPHVVRDARGRLIEDTRYGVRNPDLVGLTCFGVGWQYVFHSGEDLYRTDGTSATGAEVTAAADGTIVYADPSADYPGLVIIIEHTLPGGDKIYSVYAHLNGDSLAVKQGQRVVRGQRLATVMYQAYAGRFPERHPSGDDSHLHFEIRHFMSGLYVYGTAYPACNGLIAGRGYTYPGSPDSFPSPTNSYTDPARLVVGKG